MISPVQVFGNSPIDAKCTSVAERYRNLITVEIKTKLLTFLQKVNKCPG